MRFALLIALSHLRSRKKEFAVSAITLISVVGVTVGVTALNMVLSVMAGFEIDLRDKILGSNAHIVVLRYGAPIEGYEEPLAKIEATDGIKGAAPFVYTEMMIKSSHGAAGVILKGIDPQRADRVIDLVGNIVMGPEGATSDRAAQQKVLDQLHAPPALRPPAPSGPTGPDPDGLNPDGLGALVPPPPVEGAPAAPAPEATPEAAGAPADDGAQLPGILIGEELANDLKVFVGDRVYLINPANLAPGLFGMPNVQIRSFRVAGIFYSGMYEYDTKWTYITIPDAQDFLKMGPAVTGIEATVHDIFGVDRISLQIEEALQFPYYTRHWKNLNRNLFSALKLEKVVMGLILGLIVAVAALNIAGMLILVVLSKGREIAIMRAMGATKQQIRLIFVIEGLVIGLVGGSVGTVLGVTGSVLLDRYGWPLDTDVYYLDRLPVQIEPEMVALVGVMAVVICFVATLYPAWRASSIAPAEALRYE